MNGYELSRNWFEFSFNNPEKINPGHSAIYFFAIEHCNRLGWKNKFGFPSQMVMEAVGIRNWKTYTKYLNDLVDWGFINMIEISKNQYSSNIIAIVKNTKATTKALDKALSKHSTKHSPKHYQSTATIDKQETSNNITSNNTISKDIVTEVETITYGNDDINKILSFLTKSVGIDEFKESRQRQRNYGKHFCGYIAKVGRENFIERLKGVLSDDFKSKNCNSIKYLYNEVKAFIYNPVLEKKETVITEV